LGFIDTFHAIRHNAAVFVPAAFFEEFIMQRFNNKVALITGAASGIGRATAERLVQEGAAVFCVDVQEAALKETVAELEKAGGKAEAFICDIGDEGQVKACVKRCIDSFGQLDVLVNMAGILRFAHTHECSLDTFMLITRINLVGTFLLCREALPELVKTKGNIVNAASTAALQGLPWGAAYGASKAGIHAMTNSIAIDYAAQGVRANCVAPGDIVTPIASGLEFPKDANFELLRRCQSLTGGKGPEVVAGVIAMLASEDGTHITGECIRVDGGMLS
jgi:NAD(P)-dependent dehydrogenase (short-subunit alcohol dehydrogenase family)